jgi:hypothetical protein
MGALSVARFTLAACVLLGVAVCGLVLQTSHSFFFGAMFLAGVGIALALAFLRNSKATWFSFGIAVLYVLYIMDLFANLSRSPGGMN